jgi:hypothetical protein
VQLRKTIELIVQTTKCYLWSWFFTIKFKILAVIRI